MPFISIFFASKQTDSAHSAPRSIDNCLPGCQLRRCDRAVTPRANQPHRQACLTDRDFQIPARTRVRTLGNLLPSQRGRDGDALQRQFFTLLIPADTVSPSGPVAPLPPGLTESPHARLHKGNITDLLCGNSTDILILPSIQASITSIFCLSGSRSRGRPGAHLPSHP